ncbi:methylated-DNA--[protein]-cysteine S-methyltransferase [Streptomyces cellulosae]
MDGDGRYGQRVVWAVVDTAIGPLLLAATREGLVNVVFHASDEVRDKALERLASRLGREPVEEPGSPLAATVPFGTVVGYGDLAGRVGQPGAAQAVGMAMGANPLPVVVPCHRVVESGGGIGGFGGGLETKRRLLALEGVLPEPLF